MGNDTWSDTGHGTEFDLDIQYFKEIHALQIKIIVSSSLIGDPTPSSYTSDLKSTDYSVPAIRLSIAPHFSHPFRPFLDAE
jgi:hypothetical protein